MRRETSIVGRIVLIAVAIAASTVLLAASGYRYDYDYPDQGDDWYGRSAGPDARRDYPAFEMDLFSAGDDYGYGFEPSVDALGQGPPLALTRRRHTEYHFRFFTLVGCLEAVDCADGVFCNGEEVCSPSGCAPGTPACDDAEPCTIDSCDEPSESCDNTWVPAPDEVEGLRLADQAAGSSVAALSWDAVPEAEWYNVYRGERGDLGDLACFIGEVSGTSVDDDGTVAAGGLYCFLTSAVYCDLESSLGDGSEGARPDPPPCP